MGFFLTKFKRFIFTMKYFRKYPVVKVFPERTTISQGSSVELQCEVSGSPIPTIKWTKLGEEFRPNVEQVGSVLYIRNAQVADRGMYVCVAKNSHGMQQASGVVEVTSECFIDNERKPS